MRKQVLLFSVLLLSITNGLLAQNTIVGKWKPAAVVLAELGRLVLQEDSLRAILLQKSAAATPGIPIAAADSQQVDQMVTQIIQTLGSMQFEFKANKTYTSTVDGKKTTGPYIYNAAKHTLVLNPKSKKENKATVTFENGWLKMENFGDGMVFYLQRAE